jgi:hypothetical protein
MPLVYIDDSGVQRLRALSTLLKPPDAERDAFLLLTDFRRG